MKRLLGLGFILCMMVFMVSSSKGQIHLQGTVGVKAPLGDFGTVTNINSGGSMTATFRAMMGDQIGVGANLGVNKIGNSWLIPLTGLFEYHFPVSIVTAYGGMDMGFYLWNYRYFAAPHLGSVATTRLCFGFAPTTGAIYKFNDMLSFTAGGKGHFWFRDGMRFAMGLNAGVIYTLK